MDTVYPYYAVMRVAMDGLYEFLCDSITVFGDDCDFPVWRPEDSPYLVFWNSVAQALEHIGKNPKCVQTDKSIFVVKVYVMAGGLIKTRCEPVAEVEPFPDCRRCQNQGGCDCHRYARGAGVCRLNARGCQ